MDLPTITLLSGTLLTGLVAGLLYGFACAVIPGLGALPDREYLGAMQSVNRQIQNPVFFISFMGSFILLPVCAFVLYRNNGFAMPTGPVLAAAIIYLLTVFGTTVTGNIPLNEMLANTSLPDLSVTELKTLRARFENPWNTLHQLRTCASILSFALMIFACWTKNRF